MSVRVHVQNFQSIHEAEVVIDGFTVVTGTNNTGKTALQRAIRGVFQNTPGTSFIREGETTCQVTVGFDDHTVTWWKGTGKRDRPTYIVDGGEPLYPGQAVPDEVAALGVVPIQAGGQEVWPTIAPQFSGQIFLLDKPGSAVAEAVADVERVGQLNRALRNAESDRRTAAATLKVRMSDLVGFEVQAQKFQGLDEAVTGVKLLEEAHTSAQRLGKAVQGLTSLRDRLALAKVAAAHLAPAGMITVPDNKEALGLRQELEALRKVQQRLQKAQQEARRLAGADTLMVSVDESASRRLLDGLKVLKEFRTRLTAVRQRVEAGQDELAKAVTASIVADQEFNEALADLGMCPTCGTEVKS